MFETAVALVIFLFPLAYSPGPGNMFFAANGARFGLAATLPASAGYHVATWAVTAAIGLGFIAALDQFPGVFAALKIAGSLYVLWIAWGMIRAGALTAGKEAVPASFMDGVVLMVLNPKAYVIIALMFTQFLDGASAEGWLTSVLLITTIFTINNLIAFTVWTVVGDRIAGYFRTDESARRLNVVFGGILAAVAIWMLVS